jgi:hypothetical protein
MASQANSVADLPPGGSSSPPKTEDTKTPPETSNAAEKEPKTNDRKDRKQKKSGKEKCTKKHTKTKTKKAKKHTPVEESSSSESSTYDDESGSSSSDDSDSSDDESSAEEQVLKRKRSKKHQQVTKSKKKAQGKKPKKAGKLQLETASDSVSDLSESEDIDDSDIDDPRSLAKRLAALELQQHNAFQPFGTNSIPPPGLTTSIPPIYDQGIRIVPPAGRGRRGGRLPPPGRGRGLAGLAPDLILDKRHQQKIKKKKPNGTRLEYKRVDQVWDNNLHNYKLQDTAETTTDTQYDEFLFHVRRTFDWEGKYKTTIVDIKSKPLRECLQDVMGNVKGVSLVEETPKLDPNMLFL